MQLPDYINEMLHVIARDEGIRKYEIITESGSSHGDNIHGVMVAIKLVDQTRSNAEPLHLMCKMAPTSKEYRDSSQSAWLFKREIYLYTRVFPAFVDFQRDKELSDSDRFLAFPKVYATYVNDENETYALILEDMRPQKYMLWPRYDPMPLHHAEMVLGKLAKLHAVSMALKDQRPLVFDEFKELHDVAEIQIERGNFGKVIEGALEQAINFLTDDQHKKIMRKCRRDYRRILNECFAKDAIDRFGVINHGDCWINNYLFQYAEDTHQVANVCFVDWQLSRYSSPALDVLYMIFSSTQKGLRDRSYSDLIRYYYTVFSDTVRKLGSDPDKLLGFSNFENELKASGRFILVMGTLVIQYALAHPNDIRNMDEYSEQLTSDNNRTAPSLLKKISDDSDIRVAAINDLVGDIIAYGYDCN